MIHRLQELSRSDAKDVGGKAANLGELNSLGVRVPQGFVISASIATAFLDSCLAQAEESLRVPRERIPCEHAGVLHSLVMQATLESEIEEAILRSFEELGASLVSVRSSATMEDSARMSFAGIFDTWLYIPTYTLVPAIKKCWLSLYSRRALDYYSIHKVGIFQPQMAVIVQAMVDPDVSGVCFTANPISGNQEELYIEAVWGAGDALVSGRLTPDSYLYNTPSRTITGRSISRQDLKFVWREGGSMGISVDPSLVDAQKISDDLLHRLAVDCGRIGEHYQQPQDIEFAVNGDTIYFLQSRPITVL